MSGGVDSAVVLARAGSDAVGVTLRLWVDPEAPHGERACCSADAVRSARRACHRLGLPHVTLDLREEFRRAVVEPFVRGYARGETPNPCTRCNGAFRFGELLAFTKRAGAATARDRPLRADRRAPRPAPDRPSAPTLQKDQSYMLATLDPRRLGRVVFPLGDQTKEETRAEAVALGLEAAGRAESQEACFLGGDDYRAFLERRGLAPARGPIVDEAGNEIGMHDGHWRFTPGQRRGLGVASAEPLYAIATIAQTNTVVAGPAASLACRNVRARGRLFVPWSAWRRSSATARRASPRA